MSAPVYKILSATQWAKFEAEGEYAGTDFDKADGYIHLSAADQLAGTAARHFAERTDLVALAIDQEKLGKGLKWDKVRDHVYFPHFYGVLQRDWVLSADPIPDEPEARALALAMLGL